MVDNQPYGPNIPESEQQACYRLVEQLSGSERSYRELVENLPDVVFRTDEHFCFSFLNDAWTALTGIARTDAAGRPISDYVVEQSRSTWEDFLGNQGVGAQKGHVSELCLRHADGGHR